ncbi:hypothetical protein [Neobacillus sp. 204]|uniref:hypothetical protein n=1 Tax=Neobacillus sp. 204 TaxID=3383351 RepID=UPI0039799568
MEKKNRAVREMLREEKLAIFDLLIKAELSKEVRTSDGSNGCFDAYSSDETDHRSC